MDRVHLHVATRQVSTKVITRTNSRRIFTARPKGQRWRRRVRRGERGWAADCEVQTLRALHKACMHMESEKSRPMRSDLIGPVWEPRLAEELTKAGIEFLAQYDACGFFLDFAIFPEDAKDRGLPVMLNIEVDGETYHRDRKGRLRAQDIRRDHILTASGWKVQRFWVYELREEMDSCMQTIRTLAGKS